MAPWFFDAGLTILGMNIRSFRIDGCPCRFDIHVSNIVIMNTGIPTESNRACIRLQLVRNHINNVCVAFVLNNVSGVLLGSRSNGTPC